MNVSCSCQQKLECCHIQSQNGSKWYLGIFLRAMVLQRGGFITFNVGTYTQDQEGANLQFIEHQLLEFMGGPWVSYESFRTWDVIRYTYYEHIHSWRNQDELRGRITFDIYRRKQAISHTFSYVTINANISQIWHAIVKVARYPCCCRENYDKVALFRGAGNN